MARPSTLSIGLGLRPGDALLVPARTLHSAMPLRSLLLTRVLPALLTLVALCGLASAQGAPTLGDVATQRIDLVAGPNLVSLSVYPADSRVETILKDALDEIVLVKDASGAVFAPGYGVYVLDRWRWDEAHLVYARSPVSVVVEGRRIGTGSPVVLSEGWNWAPFFALADTPVEDALATIAGAVTRVESADGRVYPDDGASPRLVTLAPGQGYRVHVARTDTLVYNGDVPPPAPPGERVAVASIAEALALEGLAPGQVVEVAGYYEPGDGGGGTFEVTASGVAPDGGTVFVPNEYVSGVVTETHQFRSSRRMTKVPEGEAVVFGSLTLELLDSSGGLVTRLPDKHLHGHSWSGSVALSPHVLYGEGVFQDRSARIGKFLNGAIGDARDGQARFTYRHTTGPIRLHRQGVRSDLDVTWFGARTERESPGFDNQPVLCHTLNVAQAMNEDGRTIEAVVFPKTEVYGYFGTVEVPERITIRGAGGTYLATATDDLGNTYRPVRIRDAHTRLRVLDAEALKYFRMEKDPTDRYHLPSDAKHVVRTRRTRITASTGVTALGLEDIVLDGNWQGNMQAWNEGWGTRSEFEAYLRNQPGWSGFIASAGKEPPQGQEVTLRNVGIIGYGATGILGHINNTWTSENLLLGDALYNHVLYGANGTYKNLTFTGFAWGHTAWMWGEVENFVYEKGAPSPIGRHAGEVFGIRGGDAYHSDEIAGLPAYTRSDGTVPPLYTTIRGFYVDLRGSQSWAPFDGLGSNVSITGTSEKDRGVVIVPENAASIGLFSEDGNGHQDALYAKNEFGNAYIYSSGDLNYITKDLNVTNLKVYNIKVIRSRGIGGYSFLFAARRREHPSWDTPQIQVFDNIVNERTHFIASVDVESDAPAGMNVFVLNSSFDNRSSRPFNGSGGGRLTDLKSGGDPTKLRVYLEDTVFNVPTSAFSNSELFFAMSRFRRCTDRLTGRTSEATRTLDESDFDGLEAVVSLGLFWTPESRDYVRIGGTGASKVEAWRITDAAGAALGVDKRDPHISVTLSEPLGPSETLRVEAAVRPWEDGIAVPDIVP